MQFTGREEVQGSSEPVEPLARALLLSTTAMIDSAYIQGLFPTDLRSGLPAAPQQCGEHHVRSYRAWRAWFLLGPHHFLHGPVVRRTSSLTNNRLTSSVNRSCTACSEVSVMRRDAR